MSAPTIDGEKARLMLARREARAIDLRPQEEVAEGHAPGAIFAAVDDLETAVERALGDEKMPLIVFSEDGERAAEVVETLRERGHEAAAVKGGWESWLSDGHPVQPGVDEEYEGPDLVQPGVTSPAGPDEEDEEEAEEGPSEDATEQAPGRRSEDRPAEDLRSSAVEDVEESRPEQLEGREPERDEPDEGRAEGDEQPDEGRAER